MVICVLLRLSAWGPVLTAACRSAHQTPRESKRNLSKGPSCGVKGDWPFLAWWPSWKQKRSSPSGYLRLPKWAESIAVARAGCGLGPWDPNPAGTCPSLAPGVHQRREQERLRQQKWGMQPAWPGASEHGGLSPPRLLSPPGLQAHLLHNTALSSRNSCFHSPPSSWSVIQLSLPHTSCSCTLWMTNVFALLFRESSKHEKQPIIYREVWIQNTQQEPRLASEATVSSTEACLLEAWPVQVQPQLTGEQSVLWKSENNFFFFF